LRFFSLRPEAVPEYFRELFAEGVSLCFVSFCDVSKQPDGHMIEAAEGGSENLLIYDYAKAKNSFSGEGRETLSRALSGK